MSPLLHKLYIGLMTLIVVLVSLYLAYTGYDYYNTPLVERFYHTRHDWFKPSGAYGHGLGIVGTLMILFGVTIYIARKRYNFLVRFIRLKYLLEFHIFLCTLGPIMVLFHTAFKFGGIVSIAFWSMVAVVASGVVGRFIYIQIPRSIEGRELTLKEVESLREEMNEKLSQNPNVDSEILTELNKSAEVTESKSIVETYKHGRSTIKKINSMLILRKIESSERAEILSNVKKEVSINNKIARLQTAQKLFQYWHVAHMPFALIMLVIVVIHVGVTLAFGYKWIF